MKPFSLIIPAYNEEEILEGNSKRLLEYLSELDVEYEIIIVSNGSNDLTEKIGVELEQQCQSVRFFALPVKGVGLAFKKGIAEARFEHIIFMDADLSADLEFVAKANQLLDQHVLVLGAKFKGLQNRGWFRQLGSGIFYLSVLLLMGLQYVDYAPGAKAYQKSFLQKYFNYIDDHTSFVLNLTFIASIKREPIVEISINCDDRRKSRFNLWQEAVSKYKGLFSLKLKQMLGKI